MLEQAHRFDDMLHEQSIQSPLSLRKRSGMAHNDSLSLRSPMAFSPNGRNQMHNDYKSFLHGGQANQTPMGAPSLAGGRRGVSMLPSVTSPVREISVQQPHIRLSKELKSKLENMNSPQPGNRANRVGTSKFKKDDETADAAKNALRRNHQRM